MDYGFIIFHNLNLLLLNSMQKYGKDYTFYNFLIKKSSY
nr:MAG TPA: hypothetical protein [Caudoviricetes sp.]